MLSEAVELPCPISLLQLPLDPESVGKEAVSVVKYVVFVFFGYSLRVIISFSTRSRRRLKSLRRGPSALSVLCRFLMSALLMVLVSRVAVMKAGRKDGYADD